MYNNDNRGGTLMSIRLLQGQRQCSRLRMVSRLPSAVSNIIMGITSSLTGTIEPMVTRTVIPSTQTGSMASVDMTLIPDGGY